MPDVAIEREVTLHYEDDYFGDPWRVPETVLLIHGVAESGQAWFAWVPHLAREYRVVRVDLRGFGRSTVPPPAFPWSPMGLAADLASFLSTLGIERAHVAGAKVGGTVAMQFAADYPERTQSLSVVSSPVRSRNTGGRADLRTFEERVRNLGVRGWAAETQRERLGSEVSEQQIDWWTDFMAQTDPEVCAAIQVMVGTLDISAALPLIKAPTLVVTTENSALASLSVVREWQQQIAGSELAVLPGDSYHVAAARPDECAERVLAFIRLHGGA